MRSCSLVFTLPSNTPDSKTWISTLIPTLAAWTEWTVARDPVLEVADPELGYPIGISRSARRAFAFSGSKCMFFDVLRGERAGRDQRSGG